MKLCPTCGEVYADRTLRCRAHDVPLADWTDAMDQGAITDAEGRVAVTSTPLELRGLDVEIGRATTPARGSEDPAHAETPRAHTSGELQRLRAPSRGHVLGERYRLSSQIGVGGYGAVFAAFDQLTRDRVAIKVLSPAATQSQEMITRFHREAIAASRVRHPNIVDVTDFDVDGEGIHYLVMEYLDGRDLAATLDGARSLPPARALCIAAQCARGLAAAHRVGILHRDLKPANVFLVRGEAGADVVKIIDFGISKLTRAAGDYTDLTSASKVVGTPCYMSPEQARGAVLDARSDVYALGVMIFEMLIGERPFTGRSPISIMTKHLQAPRVAPSALRPELAACPGLDALVVSAIARDPAKRFASMAQLGDAIVACLRAIDPAAAEALDDRTAENPDPPEVAPALAPSSDVTRVRRRSTRVRSLGLALGAVAVATTAVMVAWLGRAGHAETPTSSPARAAPPAAAQPDRGAAPAVVPVAVPVTLPIVVPAAAIEPDAPRQEAREILVRSSPRGAKVFRDGAWLGTTPIGIVFEPGTESTELTLEAPGHRRRRIVVRPDRDAVDVVLTRRARRPAPAARLGVEEW